MSNWRWVELGIGFLCCVDSKDSIPPLELFIVTAVSNCEVSKQYFWMEHFTSILHLSNYKNDGYEKILVETFFLYANWIFWVEIWWILIENLNLTNFLEKP